MHKSGNKHVPSTCSDKHALGIGLEHANTKGTLLRRTEFPARETAITARDDITAGHSRQFTARGTAADITAGGSANITATDVQRSEQFRRPPAIRDVFALAPVLLQKLSQCRITIVTKPLTVVGFFVIPYTHNSCTTLAKRWYVYINDRAGGCVVGLYCARGNNCKNSMRQQTLVRYIFWKSLPLGSGCFRDTRGRLVADGLFKPFDN